LPLNYKSPKKKLAFKKIHSEKKLIFHKKIYIQNFYAVFYFNLQATQWE